MIDEMLIAKIRSYFSANDDTYAVYLFGSQAKGTSRPTSDFDLAVLFKEGLEPYRRFQMKLQITNDLIDLLKHKVDVVDLRSADLCFIHQIMLHKVLLYERAKSERVTFEVDYRKRYFDHVPILNRYHEQVRKRLLERRAKVRD